jgi:hypothetical protein
MQIIFDKPGKRMNNFRILVVTEEHVEDGAVFEVDEKNARDYIKAGKAHEFKEEQKPEPPPEETGDDDYGTDIDKMTIPQLREYAKNRDPEIDLGDLKKKDDILEAVKKFIEENETGDGEDSTAQNND